MSSALTPPADQEVALELLGRMLRIRRLEETIRDLRLAGDIVGSVHLCIGQEAIPVGACLARRAQDPVYATYRGHGWALASGVPAQAILAELLGRETGVNAGRGGSAYFSGASVGFMGENSIVGAGAPIAVGAALAGRHDGSGRVPICSFGDGAMNQGALHEALNFASAFKLPTVFLCENNGWSELTPIEDMVGSAELWKRASAYGMTGVRIDGNDPFVVESAVRSAIERGVAGEGPTLIEAMTARLCGHYIGDAEQYRRPGELAAAAECEPIVVLEQRLLTGSDGFARTDPAVIATLRGRIDAEISIARDGALAAPLSDTSRVQEHLYV
jgi:TPP-dependent pyruvate/acetoin dehydrogenase alpha subunit